MFLISPFLIYLAIRRKKETLFKEVEQLATQTDPHKCNSSLNSTEPSVLTNVTASEIKCYHKTSPVRNRFLLTNYAKMKMEQNDFLKSIESTIANKETRHRVHSLGEGGGKKVN